MKNDPEDSQSQDTENERVLPEESGAEEDAVLSKPLLPTWYRRLMSAFRADLFACRHVDLFFHCSDGVSVSAHLVVVALACPALGELAVDALRSSEGDFRFSLPDFSSAAVRVFIQVIYAGSASNDDPEIIEECSRLEDVLGVEITSQESFKGDDDDTEGMGDEEEVDAPTSTKLEGEMFRVEEVTIDEPILLQNKDPLFTDDSNILSSSCPVCDKSVDSHGRQIVDEESSTRRVFLCCLDSCSFKTVMKTAEKFLEHVWMHVSQTDSLRRCPLCNKTRAKHKNADPEVLAARRDPRRGCPYKCCHCRAAKLTAKSFFEHVENHVSKRFKCGECERGYSSRRFLDQHVDREHGAGRGVFHHCQFSNCGFKSRYKQAVALHRKDKHEGRKAKSAAATAAKTKSREAGSAAATAAAGVTCPYCKKKFKQWQYLNVHKKKCAAAKLQYQCDICLASGFANSVTLKNHVRSKHSDERPFACEYCSARYSTSMSLSMHRARKHNVNKAGEFVPKKRFPCPKCGSILTDRTKLLRHIKTIHENVKDWKCGYCEKTFSSKSNLQVHEGKNHGGRLPYQCPVCAKGFSRKPALAEHVAVAHAQQDRDRQEGDGDREAPAAAQSSWRDEERTAFFVVEES